MAGAAVAAPKEKELDDAPNAAPVLAVLAPPNEKAAAAGAVTAAGADAPKDGIDILDPPNSGPVLAEVVDVDAGAPKVEPVENADAPELAPNENADAEGAEPVAAGAAPKVGTAPVWCTIENQFSHHPARANQSPRACAADTGAARSRHRDR